MTPHTPEVLDESECWNLLSHDSLGRIALSTSDGPDIFPVNYLVNDHAVFFRTSPGAKLMELTEDPRVAFEVDGKRFGHHWSVVLRGTARRLDDDAEIHESGVLALSTATDTAKWNYVRITPHAVTGRRT